VAGVIYEGAPKQKVFKMINQQKKSLFGMIEVLNNSARVKFSMPSNEQQCNGSQKNFLKDFNKKVKPV
jgi:hypothetical protein